MTEWAINVPFRTRDESLIDTAAACRYLPEGERDVARQVVFSAMERGGSAMTAGQLLDELDGMDTAARRALLDAARVEAGLESIADVDAGERAEAASKTGAVIAASYNRTQMCHGRTPTGARCNAIPFRDGVPATVNERRWHCDEHRAQATPEDLAPHPAPWKYSPVGAIIPNDPAETSREAAAAESRRRQEQARLEDAAAAAEIARAHKAAADAARNQELPAHLRDLVA